MTLKYKKEIIIISISFLLCLSVFAYIKCFFFHDRSLNAPLKNVIEYYHEEENKPKYKMATTKIVPTTTSLLTTSSNIPDEDMPYIEEITDYPYRNPPVFEDDGSIIYEGMTLTELTNKLNNHLKGYLMNTGYFFAKYTKDTGMDPYLSVSIVLLETGCKWTCSFLTVECNNIGGLKGGKSCNNGSYSKYDTLDDGIAGYLSIIYNNYYLKGMDTADKMASTYAESPTWAYKVNKYIEEIRNS